MKGFVLHATASAASTKPLFGISVCTDVCTCTGCANKEDYKQLDDERELEEIAFDTDEEL